MSEFIDTAMVTDDFVAALASVLATCEAEWQPATGKAAELIIDRLGVAPENIGFITTSWGWAAVIQLSRTPLGTTDDGEVAVVDEQSDVRTGSWESVMADEAMYVTPSTKFVGPMWVDCFEDYSPPLHFDADAWEETAEMYSGHSEWMVWVDGEMTQFRLQEHVLWGSTPPSIPAVSWLGVDCESTGISITTDECGCVWGVFVEFATVFLGRPTTIEGRLAEYVSTVCWLGGGFSVHSVEGADVAPAEMLDVLSSLEPCDPNWCDAEISVTFTGFDGTVEELRELLSGSLPDGRFSADEVHGTICRTPDNLWRATILSSAAEADTMVGAILALPLGGRPSLILTDIVLRGDAVTAEEAHGVPFVTGDGSMHLDELIPDGEHVSEHPDFVEVASVYPSEMAVNDDLACGGIGDESELLRVGGIGSLYFELDVDAWRWNRLGWFDTPKEAAEAATGPDARYEML